MQVVTEDRLQLFAEMEAKYEKNDTDYFVNLLDHPDYVIRTRATCILVDFGGEDKVPHISKVLKYDENELVRHEAAFSLGQMCFSSGVEPLVEATLNDSSMFVRHVAKNALEKALNDPDKPVVESAIVALSNIQFMDKLSKNEKFAKLTGG